MWRTVVMLSSVMSLNTSCHSGAGSGLASALSPFEAMVADQLDIAMATPGFAVAFEKLQKQSFGASLAGLVDAATDESFTFNGRTFTGIKQALDKKREQLSEAASLDTMFGSHSELFAAQGLRSGMEPADSQAFVKVATTAMSHLSGGAEQPLDARTLARALRVSLALAVLDTMPADTDPALRLLATEGTIKATAPATPATPAASTTPASASAKKAWSRDKCANFDKDSKQPEWMCVRDSAEMQNAKASTGYYTAVNGKDTWTDFYSAAKHSICSSKDQYSDSAGETKTWGWTGTESCHAPFSDEARGIGGATTRAETEKTAAVSSAAAAAGTSNTEKKTDSSGAQASVTSTKELSKTNTTKQKATSCTWTSTGDAEPPTKTVKCGGKAPGYVKPSNCNCAE